MTLGAIGVPAATPLCGSQSLLSGRSVATKQAFLLWLPALQLSKH